MSWNTLRAWIEVQKLPRHPYDIFSFLLGSVLAWYATGQFHWGVFITGLLAVFLIANGIYLTNEYQDYEGDRQNQERIGGEGGMGLVTTGGTRVLVRGQLKRQHVLVAGIVCFALAIPLGLIIQFVFKTGPLTIPLGVVGMLITYSYSNPPIKASYRGLGELSMMLAYIMLVITAYYIQAGWSWLPLLIGLPRFLMTPASKTLREFPDYKADAAAGKRTLVVIFGQQKMSYMYIALTCAAILLFIPTLVITRTPFAFINLWPIYYLTQSLIPVVKGEWRTRQGLERACRRGAVGSMLTPLTIAVTFLLDGFINVV